MIEICKQNFNLIHPEYFNHINPWFNRGLIKNQKRLMKYWTRFGWQEKAQNFEPKKGAVDYNQFIKNAKSTFDLLVSKESGIEQNTKLIKKFQRLINLYGQEIAFVSLLHVIDDYFTEINQQEVSKKRLLVIQLVNQEIEQIYQAYQKMLLTIFTPIPELQAKVKEVFTNDRVYTDRVFDPSFNLRTLFKFSQKAASNRKISIADFNKIYFNSLFANNYFVNLQYYSQNFINSIY